MYKISELAEEDIYLIARYTIQQFGVVQAKHYHAEMTRMFELLDSSPCIGRECDWVCDGMYRFEFGKHTIYYMPQGADIFIARILHQSMDIEAQDFPE